MTYPHPDITFDGTPITAFIHVAPGVWIRPKGVSWS